MELDRTRLTAQFRVLDVTVHSAALDKNMPLRMIVPADPAVAAHELPIVYFLHGAGTNFHDWTNNSGVAGFAAQGFVLVFPDAPGSYYIDDLRGSHNRYEQYLTQEIPAVVHASIPAATRDPRSTAIVGISRGGYGAVVLGLKHPELFSFIGAISGALDMNHRHFHWSHPSDSQDLDRAFGPVGSSARRDNDADTLLTGVHSDRSPYFFVACGSNDSLFGLSQRFADRLAKQRLPSESHFSPGGHNWSFWGAQLPALEAALRTRLASATPQPPPAGTR